ncbi:hypothetical protein [Actinoplanes sp. M2I2]|uniref:hypothetical protein n=1 Tax=Actinoplanes sp. M2I2 TaxID=1734444 RepID=UPI002021939A|nr:hypothetical protein [Actinoplanes sp. M2I2]
MVGRWRQAFSDKQLRQAGRLIDEATRLSIAGRRDEAAETGERGLRMVRDVARRAPGQALPLLARATADQSWYLAGIGRHRAALELAEEALSLARTAHDVPLLARALIIAADRLLESGRAQEALARSRELIELPRLRSDTGLADSLATLSASLAETGQPEEAYQISERALRMWQTLAAEQPSLAVHAVSGRILLNHANRLYAIGRWTEAAKTATRAVAFHREIPGVDRLVRLQKLAMALSNCSIVLSRIRRHDEASAMTAEAVAISRILVAAQSGHRAQLASALRSHGGRLAALGQAEQSVEMVAEAVAIYRELAAEERSSYLPRLAEAVSDLAAVSDTENATALVEEAVDLRRELVADNRAVHLPGLALSLSILADKQGAAGRPAAALETGDESVRLIREAAEANRAGVLPRYAYLVQEQTERLDRAGRAAEALALGEEAVGVARQALGTHRAAGLGGLADALLAQARRLAAGPGRNKANKRRASELRHQADSLRTELDAMD